MSKIRKITALALCLAMGCSLAACGEETTPNTENTESTSFWYEGDAAENEAFLALTDQYFHDCYANDMLNLHFTVKDLEAYGFDRPEMDLLAESVVTEDYIAAFLSSMSEIDYDDLSRQNQITYDIMEEDLTDALAWSDLSPLASYFDYSSGLQSQLPTIATEYEFFAEEDVTDYLAMLSQIPAVFEVYLEEERARVEEGFGLSDAVLDDVCAQFDAVTEDGEESCFIDSFDERIDALDFLSAAEKRDYKEQNKTVVLDVLFPAFRETEAALGDFYGKGENDGGLCYYDGGTAYYEMIVKAKSGYAGTVDELYADLSRHISNRTTEINTIASTMTSRALNLWMKGDTGALTDAEETLAYFSTHLDGYFPSIGDTTYTVKYLSESIASTMPNTLAYYLTPQIDNYSKGSITVNGYATDSSDVMNTLAHEGYPGHLYQNVYFYSQNPDPVRTCFSFLGYTEGWAVYAANQAEFIYEYPQYDQQFALLNSINLSGIYAMYALMDIGVNYYGWDSADIMNYVGTDEETAEALFLVFVEMPGVYLSYGVGNMLMENLRGYAEVKGGDSFDLVEYHKLILDIGPCYHSLLERLTKEYYAAKEA